MGISSFLYVVCFIISKRGLSCLLSDKSILKDAKCFKGHLENESKVNLSVENMLKEDDTLQQVA